MSSVNDLDPICIGLVSDEPIRLEGLSCIFDGISLNGRAPLVPISGTLEELMGRHAIEYLVLDLQCSSIGVHTLQAIHHARPCIKLIVIGPEGDDELVMQAIMAGARAWVDLTADPDRIRLAIETVTSGSIWAPRRLLSKLIDRLLKVPDSSLTSSRPHLTIREKQVLEHILLARSNREVAQQLGIEERTVKAHVGRLMRKTGSDNRIELSMSALKWASGHLSHPRNYKVRNESGEFTNQ